MSDAILHWCSMWRFSINGIFSNLFGCVYICIYVCMYLFKCNYHNKVLMCITTFFTLAVFLAFYNRFRFIFMWQLWCLMSMLNWILTISFAWLMQTFLFEFPTKAVKTLTIQHLTLYLIALPRKSGQQKYTIFSY